MHINSVQGHKNRGGLTLMMSGQWRRWRDLPTSLWSWQEQWRRRRCLGTWTHIDDVRAMAYMTWLTYTWPHFGVNMSNSVDGGVLVHELILMISEQWQWQIHVYVNSPRWWQSHGVRDVTYIRTYFYQNINKIFSLKCDIYYDLTFKRWKILFKMQVTFICLTSIKG